MFCLLHAPRHERHTSPRRNLVQELLLVRRNPPLRGLNLYRQQSSAPEDSKNVCDFRSVRRDVGIPRLNKNSSRVVLSAETAAIAEVVEDLLLDVLFEDGRVR